MRSCAWLPAGRNGALTVEDDGKGFPFAGRYNQEQMDEDGKGPYDHQGTGQFDCR